MIRSGFFLLLILLLLPITISAQETDIERDTSYFMPFDNDFNIIMAASRGHMENVDMLLNRGANINAVTFEGVSSLMYAADNGDLEMIKLLLFRGADPNLQPSTGITALMSAVNQKHFEVAEYLITHGASPDIRDLNGVTALHHASALNYYEILEMLIFYGADLKIQDFKSNSPLITASYNNSIESVKILLNKNADINHTNELGYTPLMVAVQQENEEITKLLLDNGADIDQSNKGGMNALSFAVKTGNYQISSYLIQKGADVNHKISGSRNILEVARETHETEISELLRAEGAVPKYIPSFNIFFLGPELNFNSDDFMPGLAFGLNDSKFNFGIKAGFNFRPSAVRVIYEETESLQYQFWERRYFFHLGIEKKWKLLNLDQNFQFGPVTAISGIYSFGGYRGSDRNPDPKFIPVPAVGLYTMNNWIGLQLRYEHMNFNTPNISPGRIVFGCEFRIGLRKKKLSELRIDWIEEWDEK